MNTPLIYYDPTSEPCRAVHWLCIEGNIPHTIKYTWLTRNEHLAESFLKVNPMHQVPALKHGEFCLSEATAIMQYLVDINNCRNFWFGGEVKQRATINQYLSWYHTNLRKILTLEYFLPVLLMPAYLGVSKPANAVVAERKKALHTMLKQLNIMLSTNLYLCGDQISAPDILFASEIAALEIDAEYEATLSMYGCIIKWLDNLQQRPSYKESHKVWNYVAPLITAAVNKSENSPEWVAKACEQVGL